MGNLFARLHGNRRLYGTLQVVALVILLGFLGYAFRGTWEDAEPRLRSASFVDLGIACGIPGRVLPPLRRRLDDDPRRLRDPGAVPDRAPGRDALDARQVRARRRLDARGARGRDAARRGERHAEGACLRSPRGGPVRRRRRARLRGEPLRGGRRERVAPAAPRLCGTARVAPAPSRLPAPRTTVVPSLRSLRGAGAPVPDDGLSARLLLVHLARRRRGALLPHPLGGRGPGHLGDPVPRRHRAPSGRSWPCSRSSPPRGSAFARRRCTASCSR